MGTLAPLQPRRVIVARSCEQVRWFGPSLLPGQHTRRTASMLSRTCRDTRGVRFQRLAHADRQQPVQAYFATSRTQSPASMLSRARRDRRQWHALRARPAISGDAASARPLGIGRLPPRHVPLGLQRADPFRQHLPGEPPGRRLGVADEVAVEVLPEEVGHLQMPASVPFACAPSRSCGRARCGDARSRRPRRRRGTLPPRRRRLRAPGHRGQLQTFTPPKRTCSRQHVQGGS
jgi:hypothetical protein